MVDDLMQGGRLQHRPHVLRTLPYGPLAGMTSPTSTADEILVAAAAGSDRAAGVLYDRYGQVMYAVAYRIVRDPADAEEVVLDAFAQAWRDAARFEAGRGSVAAWLTVITRSRALDLVRSRARRARLTSAAGVSDPEGAPGMSGPAAAPDELVSTREREREVRAALDGLSVPQRTAIELAFFEGLSHSEIAERLNEPLGTVKTRVRLGMQKLRESLRPYFFEGLA
jgi:RNA polymerase sigma-70 factor (ECF subfamily)